MRYRGIFAAALVALGGSVAAWGQAAVSPAPVPETPPAYRDLKFPPLRRIPIPNVVTHTLPNGLKIYLLEDHELPVVSGTVRVRTGNLFDPADKVGLATITGIVMRSGGTKDKTGDQLDEELENIAASVESDIGESSGSVSFTGLKENTDQVLGIFRDVLTQPEFRQEKIDLAMTELRSGIARRNDDPHGIAQREFTDMVYGPDTPYGWQIEYATLDRIKRPDLIAFYQRYFFPANMLMAVWGDFQTAEMEAKLDQLFVDWKAQQSPVPVFPTVQRRPKPGIFLVKKEDVTQTFFVEGHLGGVLKDKDFPAMEILSDILGGGFQSRLVQQVRTRLGLAYDISAGWGAHYDHPGLFQIAGSTKSAATAQTLKAVQEQLDRVRTTEVTDDELETARQTALNSLVFAFDTKAKTLGRVLNYEYYGYPKDFIDQYQKALERVTRAEVLQAAKERLQPKEVTVVAVGRTEEFEKSLATLGLPVSSIDISIPEAKPAVAPKASTAGIEQGKELLARVQRAVGGTDKLASIKDLIEVAELRMAMGGGAVLKRTDLWIGPSFLREETQLPNGVITLYSDGNNGWMASPQGSGPLPPPFLKQVRSKLLRIYSSLLLSDRVPGRTVSLAGEGKLQIADDQGAAVQLFVDAKTGLPAKLQYSMPGMGGAPSTIDETFDEFEQVNGIQFPKRMTITQEGHKYADVAVQSLKVNTGLNQEDLNKKP
ncbi:MAG: pitrilysin family protein [Bryobacteraceae bacterium]